MTARLIMVCSGATSATKAAAFPLDEPLEASERTRAAGFAALLPRVRQAPASPALRAVQTAIALGLDARLDPRLGDWNLGRWAGRGIVELGETEPDHVAAWLADPAAAPHGGESLLALLDRVARWLDDCRTAGGRIVAVTHAAPIRAAILHALDAPPQAFWRVDVEPLGMIHFRSNGARWALRLGPDPGGRDDAPSP